MSATFLSPPVMSPSKGSTSSRSTGGSTPDQYWNLELDELLERVPLQKAAAASTTTRTTGSGPAPKKRSNPNNRVAAKSLPSGTAKVNLGISIEELYGLAAPPPVKRTVTPPLRSTPPKAKPTPLPIVVKPRRDRARSPLQMPSPASSRNKATRTRTLSNNSTSSSKSKSKSKSRNSLQRSVSFDKVQVREFNQILGEHPCIDNGPSLTLGWDYREKKGVCFEKYESKRHSTGNLMTSYNSHNSSPSPRRGKELLLSAQQRTNRLLALGYTMDEIAQNRKEIRKIQKQRKETLQDCYDDEA